MKKMGSFLVFLLFFTNMLCCNLQVDVKFDDFSYSKKYYAQEYFDLLSLISQTNFPQTGKYFLDNNLDCVKNEGCGQVFYLLQNIFCMSLDFSQNFNNQNIRKNILLAFADLVSDLFGKVDLDKIRQKYPQEDFDFWKDFICKQKMNEGNDFLINSFNSFERMKVINVIRSFGLALSYYLLNYIDIAVESLNDAMSFYFETKSKIKKKKTAALVFGAISNLCMQVGQILQKPAQQGILGLFGTIFGTASQIADVHAREELEEPEEMEAEKSWFVNQVLSSKLTQKILASMLSVVQNYLHEKMDVFLDYLSEKLIDLICHKEDSDEKETSNNSFNNNFFNDHEKDDDE